MDEATIRDLKEYYQVRFIDDLREFENLKLEDLKIIHDSYGFKFWLAGKAVENLKKAINYQFNKLFSQN